MDEWMTDECFDYLFTMIVCLHDHKLLVALFLLDLTSLVKKSD
jgi:hypothetical protein